MYFSEQNQTQYFKDFGKFTDEIYDLYWQTEEYQKFEGEKLKKRFVYSVKAIADHYKIPKTHIINLLLSRKQGPYLGECKGCGKLHYATSRQSLISSWTKDQLICTCQNFREKKENFYKSEDFRPHEKKQKDVIGIPEEYFVFNGPFIRAYVVNNRNVTDKFFYIKITEIKQIEDQGENCSFNTYKVSLYYSRISRVELIKAINLFLFKPDEFGEIYAK